MAISTNYIDNQLTNLLEAQQSAPHTLLLAALTYLSSNKQFSRSNSGLRLNQQAIHTLKFENEQAVEYQRTVDGYQLRSHNDQKFHQCKVSITADQIIAFIDGVQFKASFFISDENQIYLFSQSQTHEFTLYQTHHQTDKAEPTNTLQAPMNGTLLKNLVEVGESVNPEQPIAIMEAMKMEYTLKAPFSGVVKQLCYQTASLVEHGALVAIIEPDECQ